MTSINRQIWRYIDLDVSIQKNLMRGAVNSRGLAKYFIRKYNLSASVDAVISAIRRYESEKTLDEHELTVREIFQNATIVTRNNLVSITCSDKAKKDIPVLFKNKAIVTRDLPRIITGRNEVKIIAQTVSLPAVIDIVGKANILHIEENLSEVGILMKRDAIPTPGVVARITGEIALSTINIHELIICPPEVFLYVKNEDTVPAHQAIMQLVQH